MTPQNKISNIQYGYCICFLLFQELDYSNMHRITSSLSPINHRSSQSAAVNPFIVNVYYFDTKDHDLEQS